MQQNDNLQIPDYSVIDILGTGGSATVYLARHHTLQRDVALKVLNQDLAQDPAFCERFVREARDTASISDHPNVMTIHDAGHTHNVFYIALQYLPGLSLREQIESGIAIRNPLRLMQQLTSALAHVHDRGFVHRDIKPGNVLLNKAGDAVLADFGVAQLESNIECSNTAAQPVGTEKYMSPELARRSTHADTRSDLYSLGIVFYEALAGASTPELSEQAIDQQKTVTQRARLPLSKREFQPLIDKLLAKNPDDRFQSAGELLIAIEQLSNKHTMASNPARAPNNYSYLSILKFYLSKRRTAVSLSAGTLVLAILFTGSIRTHVGVIEQTANSSCPLLNQHQIDQRDTLLQLANMHYRIGRVSYPPGSNAIEAYSLASTIDPCNTTISDSLQKIKQGEYGDA